nr:calpinactam synthetase [Mortierella alpina]
MTRQPSETSSVSTLQAGGSEDETIPSVSLKDSLERKQKVFASRALELPTDRRRPAEFSSAGAELRLLLDAPLKQLLTSLGHDSGSRFSTVVLVAWSILLSRLSGEDSFIVGMGQVDELVLSSKALPVHVDLSGEPNTLQLLERVKHALAVAAVHASAKAEGTTVPTEEDKGTLYQAALYSHSGGFAQPPTGHVSVKCDLELHLLQDKEDAALSIRYASALYNKETVERYAGYLKAILANMVANSGQSITTFDITSQAEKTLVLETWNESAAEFPADRCIHQLFEQQVQRSPGAIAIVHGEQILTYRELNALTDRLACKLFEAGVSRGDAVAFLLHKSVELVTTQLAVLKVGAAYVPIDPKAPMERQAFIAKDSAAVLLVTDTSADIPSALELPLLRFDVTELSFTEMNGRYPDVAVSSLDTAYVMYTSGSTGVPKGVMVPHRGIARLVINNGFADIGPEDRVAFATNPSFDPSTFDVWAALVNGARMIVIDNDTYLDAHRLAKALDHHQVTSLILTMALFHQYAFIIGSALSKLKYLICGGEQALVEAFSEVLQHGGPVRLLNVYGPTEATVIATTYEATSVISHLDRMPIGRPMSNTQAYVLDKYQQPVPLGVVGELYIGGPGVANGYLNRPELTAQRFLADPFSKVPGARMYKSGDLVRYLPDGNLVFMGRNDDQVKVRGFRIELGEIEERLAEHSQVREVVVLAMGEGSDNKRLVAYVVAAPAENLALTLQMHLAASLPEYMIPSAFVRMDVFPLTNNGKVDRRALPEPEEDSFVRQIYEAPVGEMEKIMASIWSELLAVTQISRHDSFFALGGHSLMSIKMLDRLHRLGLTVSIKTLFESPSLSVLAEALSKHRAFTVPPNVINPEITRLIPEMLPLIDLTQDDIDRIIDNVPGGLSNIQDIYSLAPLQDGILFHHLLGTEGDPYVLISHLAFQDRVLLDEYLSAFQKAVDRHDILRTAFISDGLSTPAQVVYRHAPLSVTELALNPADGPIQEQLKQRYNHSNYRPDLTQAPLLRFAVTMGDDGRWILVQTLHHLISDHVSIEKMNAEVEKILQGQGNALPTPSQFRDFIAQVRAGPTQDEHEVFFKEMLSDIDEPTLPFGLNEIHNNGDEVNEAHMVLPQSMNDRLRAQGKRLGVSVAALCHAAWAQVLAQTSGHDHVVFGTVLVGGLLGEQSDQAGMGITINTLPFRCDMDERSVVDCVYQIHSRLAALVEHENASLALAQRCSGVPAGAPLFSALLNFRHTLMPTSDADDIEFTSREERVNHEGIEFLGAQERTNYPFTLSVEDFGSALGLTAQILQPVDPKAVCGYMEQALNSLVIALEASPDMPVSQLDVLPAEERTKLLHVWNATDSPFPDHLQVHQIFEQQVRQSPSAIAVEHGELCVCYGELDSKANRLARQLIKRGVKTGDHVATYMQRSFELIIAQLAILKAGAVYVPIDIKAPVERQAYIASDSGSKLLITDGSTNVHTQVQLPILRLDANQDHADDLQENSSSSEATAYVMYTSGSTGLPKGVMVPHRGIARLAINSGYAEIGPEDRIAFVANPAFDASTFDVWTALLNGARLVILDNDNYLDAHRLAESLARYKITAILLTSALFHQYAFIIGPALSKLRYLVCGGEQGLIEAFSEVLRHGGPVRLINAYGPTENTVIATTYEGTSAVSLLDRLPIGRPMSNTRVYVLDKNRSPVPVGAVGELYIGGAGVANGYLNRSDLTAERFLADPFSSLPSARMYKSGDLVRYLPDGNLVFMGRNDDQVKIRGFRIELGEIEERLAEHSQVREVAVLAVGESSSDKRLVAYVVSAPHDDLVQSLRDHLAVTLPGYMIPSAFVRLDALPLTNNGKVDRRALPEPDSSSYVTQEYVAPQGEIEIALAAMWFDLLKIDRVGRHDNFFVLGGHSLLAVRLMNRVSTLGVQLPLSTLFSSPTLSALAEVVSNKISQEQSMGERIPLVPREGPLEVSLAQQRLWVLAQLEGVSENYHVPVALRLRGDLNQNALELTLNTLFARHEALRTVFVPVNGQPQVQLLSADDGMPFVFHNLQEVQDKETMANQLAALEASAPFDMEKGPLVRAQLIKLAEDEHIFLLTQHHIITDGWSLGVMFRELNEFYEAHRAGATTPLAPLSIQYPDYAAWQREWLTGDRLKEQAAYWRETLAGAPVSIELPTDRPRPPQQSHAGAAVPIRLDASLTRALKTLSQRNGVTLFMTVLAAWSAVLARLSGQEDLVIGTPTANRNHPQVEQMLGFFVNTLALRLDVSGDPSAVQLLERVRKTTIAAQANQDLSFEQVVEIAQPPRRMDQTPLFQVLFAWQNNDASVLRLQNVETTVEPTQYATIKFDLELDMTEVEDEVHGSLRYSTALYERDTIDRHVGYLEAMLQWMTTSLEHSITEAPILGFAEQELLLKTWNNVNVPYPDDRCVHRLFEDQVEKAPEAIAIVHGDCSLTYHSLNRRANRLALKLIELGAQLGDNIAILLERSFELVIAQLAILKVGAAYVPIDVKAPVERQSYIASNSGSKLMITTESMEVPVQIQTPLLRLSADENDNEDVRDVVNNSLHTSTSSDAIANIMYTSGSTGLPKGVMVTHRGIARLSINNGFADFDGSDRVAFSSNPSFDPSTFEVWASLLTGAQLVIIDSETFLNPHLLAAELVRRQVTFLHMTNALLHQYAFIIGETLSKLKYLTGAAEQASIKAYSAVLSYGGPVRLLNRYGPTEATVDATAYVATTAITQLDRLPIGRPTNNTPVYVLDKHRKPVPIGVVGELYIGGPGVASGYLGRPDLTAERFVPDPFSSIQGARMYRAGDLVRYLPDGNIVFLGRNDDQVKVRGYRIELGEIQVRLAEHPQVREVAVLVTGESGDDKRLVAYVVSAPDDNLVQTLRDHLAATLPEYMIPSAFVRLDALPLTNNGKVDRRALPMPDSSSFVTREYVAPQGELEVALAAMWSEVLKIDRVGRHDNFFMLGGHSLLAVRLMNRVSTLGVQLPLSTMFSSPTLIALAEVVSSKISTEVLPHSTITATPRDGPLEVSFAQQRLWFLAQMEGVSDIYHVPVTLRLRGSLNHGALKKALDSLFARHEALRTVFVPVNGQPKVQLLSADDGLPFVLHDLEEEQDKEMMAKQLAAQEATAPFNMEKGPLVRSKLIKLAEDEHIFLLTQHHIITDGWSLGVMFRELNELYGAHCADVPSTLALFSIQYPDYAAWQREWLTGDRLKEQAAYWRETLAGAPVSIELPTDRPRPPRQSHAGAAVPIRLDANLTRALKTLSQRNGVTLFMTVLAAWSAVLARLSGQEDLVIGTPTANRNHPQVEQMLGFFVNTLALRLDVSGDPSAVQLLERVRKTTIAAQANQDLSFEQVVEIAQPPRRADQTPLFQVLFAWQNNDVGTLHLQDVKATVEQTDFDIVKFDQELILFEEEDEITGILLYATALFDRETIDRQVGYLEAMLRWMTIETDRSVGEAPILGSKEQEQLLQTWNKTDREYPSSICIHRLFEAQAELSPEVVAIIHGQSTMTYRELNSRANGIARQLVATGVKPGDLVLLLLNRSINLVAAEIAILKVGAAYVPIDIKAPLDRQAYIASDSGAKLLISDENTVVPAQIQVPLLRLSSHQESYESVQADLDEAPCASTSSHDTAYVMYTSGSTGTPKGVMVPHRGIARLVINNGFSNMGPGDRMAFGTNPSFDPSTFEVWAPLLNGACVVVVDNDDYLDAYRLAKALVHHQITCLYMTNALLNQYAFIIGRTLSELKYLFCGAQQGLIKSYSAVLEHGGPVRLVNRYGPTEITVNAATYTATSAINQMDRLPIGRPIGNTRLYVLDKHRNPVPTGVIGELFIGGPGVANGYYNRPDLTDERFLEDPFSTVQGARMYRSGDLVRYMPDGNLVFMARNDDQVKIRGYRIELGEIEVRLVEHAQVREAAVLVITESSGDTRLAAYVVADPQEKLAHALREHLGATLPEYMIPSAFVRLDSFPLTSNGKIDRRALPAPDASSFVGREYEEPRGKVEKLLADVWADLLRIDKIGRHDNFFMLGGHSLLAVRMIEKLRQLGYTLSVSALFDSPVLHTLAASLRLHEAGPEVPPNLITTATSALTPELLPLIDLTQDDIDIIVSQVPGGVANIQDVYALSPLQDGILFHHMMAAEGDPYLLMVCTAFRDRELLDRYLGAFQQVVNRHDILRTAVYWQNLTTPAQVVLRQASLSITEHSLDSADGPVVDQLMKLYDARKHRIDLRSAPLTRFVIAQDVDGRWIMLQLLHHLIGDHSTLEVTQEEIEAILQGQIDSLPAPQPYRNLIAQARMGISVEEHEEFFHKMLQDIDTPSLPYGLSDIHREGGNVSELHVMLPQDLNDRLRDHAKRLGVSLASLCHLAWAKVIAATSGQEKVVFGTVLFGRMQGGSGSDRAMGLFINTLPFRVDVGGVSTLETVRRVQTDMATLLEHEHASLALAQRCSSVPSGVPLFNALLNYRHSTIPVEEAAKDTGIEPIEGLERTNYAFVLSVEDLSSALGLTAQVVQPYDPSTICGYMQQALHNLAEVLDSAPEDPVHGLTIVPTKEYEMVVRSWNKTEASFPSDRAVHQLFEDQTKRTPNAIAVVHDDRSMTYRTLEGRAIRLARKLLDLGVQRGDNVAILLERSFNLIITQLAILNVGAAYVPIDIKAPVDRQLYILSDSGANLLVTEESMEVHAQIQTPLLRLGVTQDDTDGSQVGSLPNIAVSSLDTAYIMYTSGSTGLPKGVMTPHRGVARLAINNGYANVGSDDRIAFASNPAFDASTFDVWAPLLNGGRVIIVDADTFTTPHLLAKTLDRHEVTGLFMTTALFNQYVHSIGTSLAKLRYLLCGGEQENLESFSTLMKHGGPEHLIHCYGPTETTTFATTYEVKQIGENADRLPIGRPISNTQAYVLDQQRKPVPLGAVGELYLGGDGVANGYLNRADLTAERFLPDPFSKIEGARMYRSGDLVRYLPDGNLVFVSRNDGQVKIRGFRIELGEIQARLEEHELVKEAVIITLGDGGDKRLVAYVVAIVHEQLARILREYLSEHLPEYMVPAAFVRMDMLPVTNNGKIDRRALPKPDSTSFVTEGYIAPEGDVEIALADIWADLLKIERVGRQDNFFMLGGHSLLAVQMIGRLHRLGLSLSVRTLFDNPVLSVLAASLSQHHASPEAPANLITHDTTSITPDLLPLIDLSQDDIDHIVGIIPGGVANIQDIYGLSPLQDGILFHHMMATQGDPYLLVGCVAFDNRALVDRYLTAFQAIVDRHDILRTAIVWENVSTPAQVVLRQAALSITEHSLDPADGLIVDQLRQRYDARRHRIDLNSAPLCRFVMAQDTDRRWIVLQLLHHIVGDHSTMDIVEEEIEAILNGRADSLPAPQPYRNLIAQARMGVSAEEHETFFRKMLHDVDTPSLPYGLSDLHGEGGNITQARTMLPQDLNDKLRGFAKHLGVSLASLCHLAWAQVIASTSGQKQVVFGTVLFGRMQGGSGSDRAMGLFINTLPLRVDVEDVSVMDSVRRVQTDLASLLEHEHASLALAQRCSSVPSGTPLFSAILNYRHNAAPVKEARADTGMEVIGGNERDNFPLGLSVEDFGTALGLTTQVVEPYDPSRICGYMQQALQSLADALDHTPEDPLQSLSVLPQEEHELVVQTWNKTDYPFPSERCINLLFEDQVEKAPHAVAVVHEEVSMTYSTLNRHADGLAQKLVGLGVQRGDHVALLLERSFELIIAQLAILKAGAAYVPIDIKAPVDRQVYIISDSGAKLLITDETTEIQSQIQAPLLRINVDQANGMDEQGRKPMAQLSAASSLDTAYVMYTSGSTGLPKGVLVPHRAIAGLLINPRYKELGPDDRIAFVNNPAFDASTADVWGPLLHGSQIVIIDNDTYLDPNRLADALDRYQVTSLEPTSALFHQYAFVIGPALSKLKYLVSGGEQGLIEAYTEILRHDGPVRLLNTYGPTETTVIATAYEATTIELNQLDRVPIGRPICNARLYVLDQHRNPVPIGVTGELYIGGPGVANGYHNRPELTAERFLPDPYSKVQGARMYKSGDLVRYLPDGNLVFMGRNDDQIKIRGYRIELGEIEMRLAEHPQVREVVVLAIGDNSSDKRLVAYVVSVPQDDLIQTLRDHLSATLPEYMVPSAFVRLDAMPVTNNGKIDRRALPQPDSASFATQGFAAPQGEIESAMAAIWGEILKIDNIGRHDNFFMLGGHSLLAVRMIGTVRSRLGIELKLQSLFTAPTIAELTQKLSQGAGNQADEYGVLLPLKTQGSRPPLFCIHSGLGLSWLYMGLAKHLHPDQPLYGLQARGLDGKTSMAGSIEEMALDYIEQIRKVQPHGPYHLLGWCIGGNIAHCMASELERQGESVPLLAIMDSLGDYSVLAENDIVIDSIEEQDEGVFIEHLARYGDNDSMEEGSALWAKAMPISSNNLDLVKVFTPSVYSGDILYFKATVQQDEHSAAIDPESWRPFTLGEIEVHDIACTHMEMDKPEHIGFVGSTVAARIEDLM